MKRLIIAVIGVGVLIAGLGWYLNRPTTRAVPPEEPVAESAPAPTGDSQHAAEPVAVPLERQTLPAGPPSVAKAISRPAAAPANPALEASSLSRTVDMLLSPQASYQQKQEAWKYLGEAGKLDQAIAELEQRTANDPRSAECPAALGHAYLQKCGTIKDVREQGILAMQADKMFDTALSLDASNWEGRFMKAVAMSYWPPMLNKGDEVIQHFQTLIQQQETQTPQPQFAESYAWLGDQYQKAGRADDAKAVWQRGTGLFPADEKLRTKLASAQ
jgi:tetratricopeptide (TPR) repeat protein